MTAIASRATICSTGSTPLDCASAISSSLILREALAMSTVPLMREAIPVPDPPPVTEIRISGCAAWYRSAQARARLTIVSEPLFSIYVAEESDAVSVDEEAGPHDVNKTRTTMAMAGRRKRFIRGIIAESFTACLFIALYSLNFECYL